MSSEDPTTAAAPASAAQSDASQTKAASTPAASSTRQLYDEAKRELALKKYSPAADKLARVLEALQEGEGGEAKQEPDAPVLAPILHRYGKAVLSFAVANSGALGGGGTDQAAAAAPAPAPAAAASGSSSKAAADPRFSFGGDAEEEEEEEEEEGAQQGGGEDEDDFELAFNVLDLARVIYEKALETGGDSATLVTYEGDELPALQIKAQLAEVYNDLGDVGLETENFQQASADYEQSLNILAPLLRAHSRRLADAQLRLGLALEFHPEVSERPRALQYVKAAGETLATRLKALQAREQVLKSGDAASEAADAAAAPPADAKGKGKGKAADESEQLEKDDVASMDVAQVAREIKDVQEIIEELSVKQEEYEQAQAAPGSSAGGAAGANAIGLAGGLNREALEKAINDAFLGASTNAFGVSAAKLANQPVNDLSSMVKKKRKPEAAAASAPAAPAAAEPASEDGKGKRKVEDAVPAEAAAEGSDAKRAKAE